MLQLNSAMEAIELERADEAVGHGHARLGAVRRRRHRIGQRAARRPTAPALRRTAGGARDAGQPGATNGSATPPPARPTQLPDTRADRSPRGRPRPQRLPSTPSPSVNEAPAAEPPPRPAPSREVAAYVSPPVAEPEIAEPEPDPEPEPEPQPERRVVDLGPPPEPEQPRYALHDDRSFSFEDDDSEYDELRRPWHGGRAPVQAAAARSPRSSQAS